MQNIYGLDESCEHSDSIGLDWVCKNRPTSNPVIHTQYSHHCMDTGWPLGQLVAEKSVIPSDSQRTLPYLFHIILEGTPTSYEVPQHHGTRFRSDNARFWRRLLSDSASRTRRCLARFASSRRRHQMLWSVQYGSVQVRPASVIIRVIGITVNTRQIWVR